MKNRRLLANLYLLNIVFLTCHEIDGAYWQEWTIFGIPGGIQLFVLLHVPLAAIFIYGYGEVLDCTPKALMFSWLAIWAGVLAAGIHLSLFLMGNQAFRLPASVIVLAGGLIVSIIQATITVKQRE